MKKYPDQNRDRVTKFVLNVDDSFLKAV